ncbi:lytic murein transglycosylase [Bdellovibrio sp. qaytius]|nr:lytic murein transglycosylase [Bdellovibrio sp. qaytius]
MKLVLFAFLFVTSSLSFAQQSISNGGLTTWVPPNWQTYQAMGYDAETFKVPEGLKKSVDFWIQIYTKYTTQQGVFHVAGDTDQILGDFDLTQVYANQQWGPVRRELEAEILIKRQKKLLASRFKMDVKKIRLQMGLKDRMENAIKVSGYYLPQMEKIFEQEKIPKELTRVVFVESSFNIFAESKVGASGLWQIMPRVSKKYKYMQDAQDLRNHPIYATRLAASIFKQNYQILKSWPLAVTGYNNGVGSVGKLVKKYKSNDISYLIDNVGASKSFGFASRNFYATYLAALYVESHANLYFPEPVYKYKELEVRTVKVVKPMPYHELLSYFGQDRLKLRLYNPHIKSSYLKPGKSLPAGVIANLPKDDKAKIAGVIDQEEN